MTFNELTTDCHFLAQTDDTVYSQTDRLNSANRAMDEATTLILEADGTWQWDDENNASVTYPIGTNDLFTGQKDYKFSNEHLVIITVEVKDTNGNWTKLTPIDVTDLTESLTDFMKGTGAPQYYDKVGNALFLYPTPDYSLTRALKVRFQRKANYFTASNLSMEPGFASHLHRFVSICMALDWGYAKRLNDLITTLTPLKIKYAEDIKKFYSRREKDVQRRININTYPRI